ncbi:hypothetical protein DM02DRAFT_648714 [Periconia macrospinosa]|uniref:Zn(2)-C6 fungal-type domain-containing protein n=1 Tax=Periconia macrospinosa TaxID=97972 RepID=A0A2V1EAW0_9PLEO|nr:hypothetical protein DM02DRAFT_648714 [Periconia macrospinosa]
MPMFTETKAYHKRPHRKVRSGCTTCKRRKIKCDEIKPRCSNCQRHGATCSYVKPSSDTDPSTSRSQGRSSQSPESGRRSTSIDLSPGEIFAAHDVALMHQWSVATCYGFGDEFPGDVNPWRDDLPRLAQQHPFLMRAILAVSALHIARSSPCPTERAKYLRIAAHHQDFAFPAYRETLDKVNKDNAPAILAFSAILVVYQFATPQDGKPFASGRPEWFFLHRGLGEVPAHWHSWIDGSFLSRQMDRRRVHPVDPSVNSDDFRLVALQDMLYEMCGDKEEELAVYLDALDWLRQAFAHSCNASSRMGPKYAILFWIERVPQGYVDLLAQQEPAAVIMLTFCCVLIKRASHFWYYEGFAEHVLGELWPLVGEDNVRWIEWPLMVCGL